MNGQFPIFISSCTLFLIFPLTRLEQIHQESTQVTKRHSLGVSWWWCLGRPTLLSFVFSFLDSTRLLILFLIFLGLDSFPYLCIIFRLLNAHILKLLVRMSADSLILLILVPLAWFVPIISSLAALSRFSTVVSLLLPSHHVVRAWITACPAKMDSSK